MNKEMDVGGQRGNKRHMIDYYKPPQWNVKSQYQIKEQNVFQVNAKLATLYDESNLALLERDRALTEKTSALYDRDLAIHQRDTAIAERDNALRERDNALRERDNAIAALQFHKSTMNSLSSGAGVRGSNRSNHPPKSARRLQDKITDAFPVPVIQSGAKNITGESIHFDESTMPVPVCSCTGVSRQCYKWGDGGWQSACCTNSLSVYPLPQIKKKKHMRMGGRKMSGSVFSRLLTRMSVAGHDLSIAVDLKSHWAKHGTNRYITIK